MQFDIPVSYLFIEIYIFLILVGILIIALSEYGLFQILRDAITQVSLKCITNSISTFQLLKCMTIYYLHISYHKYLTISVQKSNHLCGLWFEVRVVMLCVMLGGFCTYGIIMRSDTFVSELGMTFPFFFYKFYALWILKHFQYNINPNDSVDEFKDKLMDQRIKNANGVNK